LADVGAGRITNEIDSSQVLEVFDRRGVSFVSITQQFNTTTSMGRLTLNVLLSFAQFEWEVTGERIRDKVAASKKKGMWMGGMPLLGYDVKNRKLVVNDAEARIVVEIYRRYLALKSVHALRDEPIRSVEALYLRLSSMTFFFSDQSSHGEVRVKGRFSRA
jgi:DNA invertase Pin-like site-specific DNA recombinase